MNENEARIWVRDGVLWLQKGATLTPTSVDDIAVDAVLRALDSDFLWAWMWKVLSRLLQEEAILVESIEVSDEVSAAAEALAVDPTKIIQLLMLIAELIKMFRK